MSKNILHMQKHFYEWYRKALSEDKMISIDTHLKMCAECRRYYEKMSTILDNPDLSALPWLTADPFLARKIMEAGNPAVPEEKNLILPAYLRWSFASILIAISFVLGIFLGKDIFYNKKLKEETQITSTYYHYFSQSSVLEGFDQIFTPTTEGNHEGQDTH